MSTAFKMNRNLFIGEYKTPKTVKSIEGIISDLQKLFHQGHYDKCIASADRLLENSISDETRASLLCRKALCYLRLCKFKKGKETMKQALTVPTETGSSTHRKITAQLAYLYGDWARHADNPEKKKKYEDRCLEWIDFSLKNGEKGRYFLFNYLGDIMCDRENYEEALKAYNRAIRREPRDFWGYRGLANVNFKMQNFAESVKYYDQAIKVLEEETITSNKCDSVKLQAFEDIESMKESRKIALESLSATKQEKQVLVVCIEEAQTTDTDTDEEEKVSSNYPKEIVSIHSFEFPDLAVNVPRFLRSGETAIRVSLKEISKSQQFEIRKLNDEGDCRIIHDSTGLALTVDGTDGIELSPLEQSLASQTWRIETRQDGASAIISNVNQKKLCAIYENDKKLRFLTKKMKLNEAGKLALQDTVKDGIDMWRLNSIN